MSLSRTLFRLCVGLALVVATIAQADEQPIKQGLVKLFEVGSQNTVKARAGAAAQYEQLVSLAPGDNRITYAFALLQAKHRNYPAAVKLIDEVLKVDKTDVFAWKAKAWLSVVSKNYAVALVDLDRLSQLLPTDEPGDDEEQQLENARYLGRIFGFLEGPVADASNAAQREAAKKRVLARLSESRTAAFEAGRSRVLAAFNTLGAEKEDSAEKAKVVAEDEREKLIKDLEGRKEQLAARRSEIGPRRDKLRSELKAEEDQLAKESQPFINQLNILNAQGTGLRRELEVLTIDLVQIRGLLDREKDPLIRARLLNDLDRVNIIAARVEGNLAVVRQQAAGVNAQLAAVQQKHLAAGARLNGELQRLENEVAGLDKQERRTNIDTTKAKKPAVGDVRKARSISAQAAALATYEEFPYEAEKQRILDSYK